MKSPLFLPIIARSIEVLVWIIHRSAIVLETSDKETNIMNPASGVNTPGTTTFNNAHNLLKKTESTCIFSFFGPEGTTAAEALGEGLRFCILSL